ncbi:MAG: hypothetical protein II499_02700 [Firmicutes bacterium]|nr:hypothetical protein [Bacillota bacterium]
MTVDPVTLISVMAAIAGVVFGVTTFFRNKKQDSTDEGKRTGAIMSELGYIKSGVDDVKRKQEKSDEAIMGFLKDLTAVQESTKQAHKRIDGLEERINKS